MRIGGLDVGTTGVKLAVYDEIGRSKGVYYREYAAREELGLHEMDFGALKEEVLGLLREAIADGGLDALGVTSFGETFALLDREDRILAPSLLYTDPRGEEETKRIGDAVGKARYAEITGVAPHSMYSIGKLLFRKEEDPERFARVDKILLGQDYVVYFLTGARKIDRSLAARTGAFDIGEKTWSEEILAAAGIEKELFSEPVETGSIAGTLLPGIRKEIGAEKAFPVVSGAHDQVAAMIGSGVFGEGRVMDGTGTVECIPLVLKEKPKELDFYEKGYSAVPYLGIGYACYAFSFTGGAMLNWFRDNFAEKERQEAAEKGESVYALLDAAASGGPTELLVLPHFAGAATPYMDISARAAVTGMTLETTKADLY
ncbi:MAG: carbohydrate kinase, partial [Clostridia bacterium]|nr:carbohydrate kinase [Clostridia bacterium]